MSSPIRVVAGLLALILIAGCTSDDPAPDEPTGTAAATTPEAATTTVKPTTTITTDSSTWLQPRMFYMVEGPVDGQYTNADVPPSGGGVRPLALVALNGSPIDTEWCGAWIDVDDIYCWGFGSSDESSQRAEVELEVELDEGPNTLVYEAMFDDGETMQLLLDIVYDPTLDSSEGWLVDVVAGDPPLAVLAVADLERGESDDFGIEPIEMIGEPRQETLPIATDAAFIIRDIDRPNDRPLRLLTADELLDLIESVKVGDTPTFVLLPEEDKIGGVPSTFLTNTDGELQQLEQWWSNDDRWSNALR